MTDVELQMNYTVMRRFASTQNALRAMLLAPDFLDSTGRSVMDVAGKHGMPLVLAATIIRLPLDDALDVHRAASNIEKKQIRRAVLSKVQSYYNEVNRGKKPLGEYRALAPRIQKFFADKP
jgi:hypothetical protein